MLNLLRYIPEFCCLWAVTLAGYSPVFAAEKQEVPALNHAFFSSLCNAFGPSGAERPVRKILAAEWGRILNPDPQSPLLALRTDGLGNLLSMLPGNRPYEGRRPKVLLMAHMDETGFMVSRIDERGFLFVSPLGGWLPHVVWSGHWNIQTRDGRLIEGISGLESGHIVSGDRSESLSFPAKFYLDIGVRSREEAKAMGIQVGSYVAPATKYRIFPNGRLVGKAFDDRAGLYVMTEVMRRLTEVPLSQWVDVEFAATVQEEIGMRGAKVIWEQTRPDIVINLEVGIARDYPFHYSSTHRADIGLGEGVSLFVYDGSMLPDQDLLAYLSEIAEKHEIPVQREFTPHYGEDGCQLQTSGTGLPVINLGIPVRYAHSSHGMIHSKDVSGTIELVLKTILSLDEHSVKRIVRESASLLLP